MKELETLNRIKVRPFNNNELAKFIERAIETVNGARVIVMEQKSYFYAEGVPFEVEKITIDQVGMVPLMEVMPLIFVEGVRHCYMVPCQIVKQDEAPIPNEVTFYFPLGAKYFEVYSDEAKSLREYFGQETFEKIEEEMLSVIIPLFNQGNKSVN